MNLSTSPPWLLKSRPCPFHYKGLCFFGDSCNFLHDLASSPIPMQNSPQNRSPRLADLLFALKDVIGQVQDDHDDSFDYSVRHSPRSDPPPPRSFPHSVPHTTGDPNEGDGPLSSSHPSRPKSINEFSHSAHAFISLQNPPRSHADLIPSDISRNSILTSSSSRRPPTPGALSDIVSPTDTTHFPNVPFLRDHDTPHLASAHPETWSSPSPLNHSPPQPAEFDLLSSPPFHHQHSNNHHAHVDLSSMLIQGPFFVSDPEDESNEEGTTRLPQRHSLSPSQGSIVEHSTARQDSLHSLYDSYSTFDSPEDFQPESSSSPPSSSSVSSHDPGRLVAPACGEESSPSPVSSAATDSLAGSSGKVAFGFRKYASDLAIRSSHDRDTLAQQGPSSSRVSSTTIAGDDLELITRPSSVSPERHGPASRLRPLRLSSALNSRFQSSSLVSPLQSSPSSPPSASSQPPYRTSTNRSNYSASLSVSSSPSPPTSLSLTEISNHDRLFLNTRSSLVNIPNRRRRGAATTDREPGSSPSRMRTREPLSPSAGRQQQQPQQSTQNRGVLRTFSSLDRYQSLHGVLSDEGEERGSRFRGRTSASRQTSLSAGSTQRQTSVPPPQPQQRLSPRTRTRVGSASGETPKPTLMFAIAGDDAGAVRAVLESGEAGPNDQVGPQSALEFTLRNDKLASKLEIVKALLAFGADTSSGSSSPGDAVRKRMDPAIRYYIGRARKRPMTSLIQTWAFRLLTDLRYELVGQDGALEQLFRVLNANAQRSLAVPVVVLLCGPSGHGKSLLTHKFGSLKVPTHTVNMTTVHSTQDLWRSFSMSVRQAPSKCTLAEFLTENEGNRCVVVLDEIDKAEDKKTLAALHMPWELARCSFGAGSPYIDTSRVIWLCTSNIGDDLVLDWNSRRIAPESPVSREEYVELMDVLRPVASDALGPALLSRVTAVLPFVPFTEEERMAIASEALHSLAGEMVRDMEVGDVESLVREALKGYQPAEGARSVYRAVSRLLINEY